MALIFLLLLFYSNKSVKVNEVNPGFGREDLVCAPSSPYANEDKYAMHKEECIFWHTFCLLHFSFPKLITFLKVVLVKFSGLTRMSGEIW